MSRLPLALATLLAVACAAPAPPAGEQIVVFAAASLADTAEEAAAVYEAAHPGIRVVVATGSSTALRTQLEHGAPADVYLAADTTNPSVLAAAGVLDGPPLAFASAELALVANLERPAVSTVADVSRPGVRLVAAGAGAPITAYAAELLSSLAAHDCCPDDLVGRYEANVVSREPDARAVLARVELGEADAAIVYAPDARRSKRVRPIPLPAGIGVRATYSGGVVARSGRRDRARHFLQWLTAGDGRAILREHGYAAP